MMLNFQLNNALIQVILVSLTCFCCPGLFNALSSFAGGIEASLAYNGSSVIYATFAVSGFMSAGIVNLLGPKHSFFIGAWGYVIYVISLWYLSSEKTMNDNIVIYSNSAEIFYYIACAILGVCAGLLWTAQGQMCMAYPTVEKKGTYFSIFWVIFNLGGCIGGFISFIANYDTSTSSETSDSTYIIFIILMALGACISILLVNPTKVIRTDGTYVTIDSLPDWKSEAVSVFKLFADPKMLLLFPLFAYSNWFYTYHSFYNVSLFNVRTRGFASAFYWGSQMVGAYFIGTFLDSGSNRKQKAFLSLYLLGFLTFSMWGIGLYAQLYYDLSYEENQLVDFKTNEFAPRFLIYIFYGFNDAICQVWSYWLLGQLTDDILQLGRYSGYYKAVQSGMAAVAWKLGGEKVDPLLQLVINWIWVAIGLIGAFFTIRLYFPSNQEIETRRESYQLTQSPMSGVYRKSITNSVDNKTTLPA